MKIPPRETTYIECSCGSDEHRIVLRHLPGAKEYDVEPDLYLTVYLDNRGPIWRRFWRATKYIIGVRRFSDFSDTLIDRGEAVLFRDALDRYIADCDRHAEEPK